MLRSIFLMLFLIPTFANGDDTKKISFNRDIRPILSDNCFRCHGRDKPARKARLRLDVRELAIAPLRRGRIAIVPGKPEKSELLTRVCAEDALDRMPPPELGKTLTQKQKDLLREWIKQGAPYEGHWAFIPPERSSIPMSISTPEWAQNPIDHFTLKRLDQEKLTPQKEADRIVLIRRLSLDLTGLPPTPEEVQTFLNDKSPDAYSRLVDRLLASPAYGERWGRVWLDLARYADSSGYADDPPRIMWPYRDWVIRAINENKPFDQFTIEQLAGDLLPKPTESQLVATGFHRNTMTNSEGGTIDEEFRNAAIVDRTRTTMEVWMGLTIQCAQCHDHKYDPISQKEYFQFFAILNNTADADRRDESPTIPIYSFEQEQQRAAIQQQIAELEKLPEENVTPKAVKKTGPLQARFVRVELVGNGVFLSLAEVQAFAGKENVATKGKATQSSVDFAGPPKLAIDGNTNGDYVAAKSTTHTKAENNPWWEVDLKKDHVLDRIVIWNRTDGGTGSRLNHFRVIALDAKRQPLWVKTIRKAPKVDLPLTLPATAEKLTKADQLELAQYRGDKTLSPNQRKIAALKKQLEGIKPVRTPVLEELAKGKRRTTHLQIRGNYLVKGEQVSEGLPTAFHKAPENPTRMTLARWLMDRRNPLTARVIVNRYWEQLFGIGLVETSEDFGTQGESPSHPELLDWLAVEMMENGWDVKKLIRLMVTSATYKQSSSVSEDLLERDPRNRLLARGPRFRLPAEMIRDQALAVSGLLSRKMLGASVRPPQPTLGLRAAFGSSTDWKTSAGEDRYRRGLYTQWRRSAPYPSMAAFDAPTREVCTVRRIRTNTPLQALVTLNDPVYVEAAQALARRMMSEGGATAEERVKHGFELCVSRSPSERELATLVKLHEKLRAKYARDPASAKMMATDPLGALPMGMDAIDAAAWTVVGNVLMNLDEFLARR